jgi:hypothetical protein
MIDGSKIGRGAKNIWQEFCSKSLIVLNINKAPKEDIFSTTSHPNLKKSIIIRCIAKYENSYIYICYIMILAYTPFEPMTCFKTMTLPLGKGKRQL